MDQDQRKCEAGDFGWDDCENPATVKSKIDGEPVWVCKECYEAAAYAKWAYWYRSAAR
jgi:hypothetical protein